VEYIPDGFDFSSKIQNDKKMYRNLKKILFSLSIISFDITVVFVKRINSPFAFLYPSENATTA
jgi:hypothetical protein